VIRRVGSVLAWFDPLTALTGPDLGAVIQGALGA
jgi:hypothetical protein